MENKAYLSLEETEQLCRLYMECSLTRLEEAELQYVLNFLPYSSPTIEETRTLLNISLSSVSGQKDHFHTKSKGKRKSLSRRNIFVAASVALLISIGIPTFIHFRQPSDYYCQVFTNGKEICGEQAIVIAEGEMERIDRFFENMQIIESEQQQKTDSF